LIVYPALLREIGRHWQTPADADAAVPGGEA
jgi:hypothetical protein